MILIFIFLLLKLVWLFVNTGQLFDCVLPINFFVIIYASKILMTRIYFAVCLVFFFSQIHILTGLPW